MVAAEDLNGEGSTSGDGKGCWSRRAWQAKEESRQKSFFVTVFS
jgi:hypothetical protein